MACGLFNFNDDLFCKRCGQRLPAFQDNQPSIVNSSSRIGPKGYSFLMASILIVMSLAFGFVAAHHHLRATRCSARTEGLLQQKYIAETTSELGIPYTENYSVRYSFQIQGRNYEGHDRLSTEPVTLEVTVHYNPADPRDSLIEPQPVSILSILLTLGLGVTGISFLVRGVLHK